MLCRTPRNQLRNSSTRAAPSSPRSTRLRNIGNSSMTRRTGCLCAAQCWSNSSPWCRQFPAFRSARNLTRKSCAPISSTLTTKRFIVLPKRDMIGRTGCTACAISAMASSAQVAPSTSAKRKTQPAASSRRPSSRATLVFPMRRCPVNNTWLPSRTRLSSICNSASRSKKSSPLTQRPVDDLMSSLYSTRRLSTNLLKCGIQQDGCQLIC